YSLFSHEEFQPYKLGSDWRMVLLDLRNHGKSAEIGGFDPPHTMKSAALDVANLLKSKSWSWPDVVIGHSMGGKIALQFAESCAQGDYGESATLPEQLWVLDSVPGEVNPSDGEVENVLRTLQSIPVPIPSRRWLVDHMVKLGFSKAISEWIGTNLKKAGSSGEQMVWSFDLNGAVEMFNSYWKESYWPLLENPPQGLEIKVVRAEKSDRWTPNVLHQMENLVSKGEEQGKGNVSYHILKDAGHWVHVDNPKGLIDIMAPHLESLSKP
ncbi:protein ABHD11, partial [Amborella trichopoda]